MLHLGFAVYSLALISGIILMAVLFFQYRLSGDKKIKVFLGFKASYTVTIILALVTLYLETNLGVSVLRFFAAGILLITVPLLLSFSSFLQLSRGMRQSRREIVINAVYSFWTLLWIIFFFVFPPGSFSFIAVGAVLVFFFLLVVLRILRRTGKKACRESMRRELRTDAAVSVLAFALILTEVVIIRPGTIERGFIISLAVTYIVINVIDWKIYVPANRRPVITDLPEGFCDHYHITESEQRVARALLAGMSNKAIAHELGVAENTIKNQIYSIYKKSRVQSRVEFVNQVKNAQLGRFTAPDDDLP